MNFIKYLWDTIRLMWRGECLQHRTPEDQYRARMSAIPCSACYGKYMKKLEAEDRARLTQKDEDGRVD